MLVGIDFDSTLAQVDEKWLGRLNRHSGTNYSVSQWTDWDLNFLSADERKVFFGLFTPDIYDTVEPYPGAREAVRQIAAIEGVTLACVTTNPSKDGEAFGAAKVRWLEKHVPELADNVIFAKVKSGLGLTMLLDDAPHHFDNPDYVPVLVERPWNQMVSTPHRFREWKDAYDVVTSALSPVRLSLPSALAPVIEMRQERALA